jgi:hypothetical protein
MSSAENFLHQRSYQATKRLSAFIGGIENSMKPEISAALEILKQFDSECKFYRAKTVKITTILSLYSSPDCHLIRILIYLLIRH